MTQSNISSSRGVRSTFLVPERVMAAKVPKNEEISAGKKNGGKKEVDCAMRRRRAIGGA